MKTTLSQRIKLLVKLGQYILKNDDEFGEIKERSFLSNSWFIPRFIDLSLNNIATQFLSENTLNSWVSKYPQLKETTDNPRLVGIVMAGNIPLVGFHDFLCVFTSGHNALIKASSKDEVLIKHLVNKLFQWEPGLEENIRFSQMLKGCDAYIATGSNSTAGYFDYYFSKYPHIIRRNRTSVAILRGDETPEELEALANDVHLYFGMGCRSITKLYVPRNYNFEPLLHIFSKYDYLSEIHKYKNNYDYNLALQLLNDKYYMATKALLLVEDQNVFSPVGQLNYEFYDNAQPVVENLEQNQSIQCIAGKGFIPFGQTQCPTMGEYADGVDTMEFLTGL